jgi:hypothetical protein
MRLEVDDKFRFVSIWLTKSDEEQKEQYIEKLQDQIDEYRAKKYKLVIYHSGDGDLLQLIGDLLSHNKNIINDEKQVENSKKECYNVVKSNESIANNFERKVCCGNKVR